MQNSNFVSFQTVFVKVYVKRMFAQEQYALHDDLMFAVILVCN